jgi:hypothetical protein
MSRFGRGLFISAHVPIIIINSLGSVYFDMRYINILNLRSCDRASCYRASCDRASCYRASCDRASCDRAS